MSYISHFLVLEPGDVITTGTPPGVGMGMKPPKFLKAGDVMELGIDGLGSQRQTVVAWSKDRRLTLCSDAGGVSAPCDGGEDERTPRGRRSS